MGIQGLLPFLSNSTRDAHISEFENNYVAIDAYCWLHKGIYSCSYELAMKKPTTKYVTYCMRFIEMLKHFKVKPILVFDGRNLSSKEETEKKRREERKRKYKKGLELIRAGKTSEGRQLLGESVDVGHEMVVNLMKECRKMNVDCIVAPFEADAQLSFLSIQKIVACVISEDSDLLVYGCEKVLFKMDKSGRGKLVEKNNIYISLGMEAEEFTEEKFRYMCILSGCDYLPSLPSIGPANALKFVKLLGDKNIIEALPRLPVYLNKLKITVSPEYILGFKIADNTFKHQLVYDPFQRKQVPLKPVENEDDIVGEKLPEDRAFQLAIGNIDPMLMKVMDNFNPDKDRGFDILWKTSSSLKYNEQKEIIYNSSQLQNGKRPSEVSLVRPELKKYCSNPSFSTKINGAQRRNTIGGVPNSGFEFKTDNQRVSISGCDSKSFLRSRYFKSLKKVHGESERNSKAMEKDRKKDESYEEYLRRIYDEQTSENENSLENDDDDSCRKLSFFNNKNTNDLIHADNDKTELLETQKNSTGKPETHHSLLDEIFKADKSEIEVDTKGSRCSQENEQNDSNSFPSSDFSHNIFKELPDLQTLCVTRPKESSPVEDGERDRVDREESEKITENEMEGMQKPSSPVFFVSKKVKNINDGFREDDWANTTGASTSPYFSSPLHNGHLTSNSVDDSASSWKKNVATRSASKANKNACKKPSSTRTLFQFGFKKQNA